MREHMGLFRGKRKDNGEWVQGAYMPHYYSSRYGKVAAIFANNDAFCKTYRYPVDPDTVGECTGLRDKNGKLIFEGDIVEGTDFTPEDGGFGVVEYDDGAFEVNGHNLTGTFHDNYWGKEFEIIGNVYDNSELLRGGEG